ncbi:replication initiation protein [Tortoise microvirus 67]|nr:replication initiation protein [Tortoise microvirus 67]
MSCLFPVTVYPNGKKAPPVEAPCRHCANCRMAKQITLNFAIGHALQDCYSRGGSASFVTMTYADQFLPDNGSLRSKDFTNWLKGARTKLFRRKIDLPFKYLAAGEYGGKLGRPHYHCILIGIPRPVAEGVFRPLWRHGHCQTEVLGSGGVRYVSEYISKQIGGRLAEQMYDAKGLERPFMRRSVNFCDDWILKNYADLVSNGWLFKSRGKMRPVPSYYVHKYFGDVDLHFLAQERNLAAKRAKMSLTDYEFMRNYTLEGMSHRASRAKGVASDSSSYDLMPFHSSCDIASLVKDALDPVPF